MDRRRFLATAVAGPAAPSLAVAAPEGNYRIDVQSHLYVPELLSLMEKRESSPRSYRHGTDQYVVVGKWVRRVLPKHTSVKAKLADMDAARIQTRHIR